MQAVGHLDEPVSYLVLVKLEPGGCAATGPVGLRLVEQTQLVQVGDQSVQKGQLGRAAPGVRGPPELRSNPGAGKRLGDGRPDEGVLE